MEGVVVQKKWVVLHNPLSNTFKIISSILLLVTKNGTHFATKSFKYLLHLSGFFSVGDGDRGIANNAFIGCCPYKGGVPSATSMVVIPRDHTSALTSYSYS